MGNGADGQIPKYFFVDFSVLYKVLLKGKYLSGGKTFCINAYKLILLFMSTWNLFFS